MSGTTDAARPASPGRRLRLAHARIRTLLDDARTGLDGSAPVAGLLADRRTPCRALAAAVVEHHREAAATLFPGLLAGHPELGPVLVRLEEDQRLVGTLVEGLCEALDDGAASAVLLRRLDALEPVLENHFRYEERQLGPVLDPTPPAPEPAR